jgi:hypothetical protein
MSANTGTTTPETPCIFHIDLTALDCTEQARILSPYIWPPQQRPGPKHRKVWKHFLQSFCHLGTHQLETPLGEWTVTKIPKRCSCSTFYHPREKRALRISNGITEIANIQERRTCRVIGSFKRHTLQNGSTLIPDDTKEQNGKQLLEWLNIQQRTTAHEEIPSWESQLIPNVD